MPKKSKPSFYAVRVGKTPGVYDNWPQCEEQTKGFNGAKYKGFATEAEARAYAFGEVQESSSKSTPLASTSDSKAKGKKRPFGEVEDESAWDVVYTDGACKGNGKAVSVAGVGVWWGHDDPRNVAERCPGDQTNNRAELIAILRVLELTPISRTPLLIKTDSQYSIKCFQDWLPNWIERNWHTSSGSPVKNAPIIRCISKLLNLRAKNRQKVVLQYVQGHVGHEGNEAADAQANLGCWKPEVEERDWDVLEKGVDRQLEETDSGAVGRGAESIPLVGVQGGPGKVVEPLPVLLESPEPKTKSRKLDNGTSASSSSLPPPAPVNSSSTMATTSAQKKDIPLSKSKTKDMPSSSSSTNKPISFKQPGSSSMSTLATAQTKFKPTSSPMPTPIPTPSLPKGYHAYPPSPIKVIFALPPLVPVNPKDVNLNDYADCLLDDEDLANELSD